MRSPITTHVLDTARGRPAAGVRAVLAHHGEHGFAEVARGTTDADGRIGAWMPEGPLKPGRWRITFDTGAWFAAQGVDAFYPEVTVHFAVTEAQAHYHVPLLLCPFGYSTYRGS